MRFEHHHEDVIGIGESRPRISWSFEGDDRDWMQGSYALEFRRDDGGVETFEIEPSDSLLVRWPAQDLSTSQRVSVRVRATDQHSNWTPWSYPATVEAGLLSKDDWTCSLIEPSTPAGEGPHRPVVFRRKVEIPSHIVKARLYVFAHGVYVAKINEVGAGDYVLAPGWTSYTHRSTYQTFDITALLSEGPNTLDVTVAEGWYCGKLGWSGGWYNIYGDKIGLIAVLVLQNSDGRTYRIGTDEDWQWAHGPYITAGLYDGVSFDMTQCINDTTPWQPVSSKLVTDNLVAPDGPPIRRTQELRPVDIFTSPSGKTLLDMGQNMVGWTKIRVNRPKGHKITLRFAEVLEDGELGTRPLRTAKATDSLILDGSGMVEWGPEFTFHGFRYVEVENWPGELNKDSVTGIVIHTDMKRTGFYSCSNKLLNQLHSNVVWSMRGNFVGIPTDCPQRDERLGWTGDINMFSETANFLFDTSGLLSSWLKDLKLEHKQANGIVPLVVPNIYEEYTKDSHAIWGDVAIMLPWSLYLAFSDLKILERQYDSMKAWLEAIPRREDGLWNYTAEWKLADWLDPAASPEDPGMARTDPMHVSDAFLVHVTDLMAQISAIVSDTDRKKKYSAQAARLRTAFQNEYVTPSGLLADNTQTAPALALNFSLLPTSSQRQRAASHLEQTVRRNARFHIATGFAGTPYMGHALASAGKSHIFYRMLLSTSCPSWLYPVTMDATTIWERWDSISEG